MTTAAGFAGWMVDLEVSFDEMARTALGFGEFAVTGRHEAPPSLHGAYLGLVGPTGAIQIGVASDEAGCQALARGLMGMTPADAALPEAEVADAVCEIINIVAGAFKGRVRDRANPLQLGLPVFIHGKVQSTEHLAVQVTEVKFGSVPAALLLVHPRSSQEA
jgi:CheY-specific phosphatase CheX